MTERWESLPGKEWIQQGLQDLSIGITSVASLLVLIGAPRLRRLGILIPKVKEIPDCPEHALYHLLEREDPRGVHSRFNGLIRRLVSFERALEGKGLRIEELKKLAGHVRLEIDLAKSRRRPSDQSGT